jgi:hypothetical protein
VALLVFSALKLELAHEVVKLLLQRVGCVSVSVTYKNAYLHIHMDIGKR